MSKVSRDIAAVDAEREFRICASCGYERGFHVSFVPTGRSDLLDIISICPNCGARYRIEGLLVKLKGAERC